jgi:hypothetical protein
MFSFRQPHAESGGALKATIRLARVSTYGAALLLALLYPLTVAAQTPTPANPNEAEIKRLQDELALRTAQVQLLTKEKEQTEAEKNLVQAYLPAATATPLAGTTTADSNVVMESQIISYKAMSEVAGYVGSQIRQKSGFSTVVVYNDKDVPVLQQLVTLKAQLDLLKRTYADLRTKPVSGQNGTESLAAGLLAPEVATTLLKSAADFLAMFRTNTDLKGNSFTPEESALVAQLPAQLGSVKLIYPALYPPRLLVAPDTGQDGLMRAISDVFEEKSSAQQAIAQYQTAYEAEDKTCKSGKPEEKDAACKDAAAYAERIARLKALNDQFDKFVAALTAVDEKSATSPLVSLLRAEKLYRLMSDSQTATLYIKVLKAGGNNKITQNLFKGTKITHSGGVVVSYILFNNAGEVTQADTLYNYDGYIRLKSRQDTLTGNFPKQPNTSAPVQTAAGGSN